MKAIFPSCEHQNVLDVLWALLNRLENNCKDAGDKMLVSNAYSFGLYGTILVAKDGEAWEVAVNNLYKKNKGDIVKLPLKNGNTEISSMYFPCEIPRRLPNAPQAVIEEIWGN